MTAEQPSTLLAAEQAARPVHYMPQLDGLRAAAVVLVVVYHLLGKTYTGGWVGVVIFFVLSGYLITSLLLVDLRRFGRLRLRRFYLRRLLRLYPPLVTAALVLAPLGVVTAGRREFILGNALALSYTTNLYAWIAQTWIGAWAHTWTLALEEQFYLVWPLLLLLGWRLARSRRAFPIALTVAAVVSLAIDIATSRGEGLTSNPLLSSGPLLLGCVLSLTSSRWRPFASRGLVGLLGIALLCIAWGLGSSPATTPWATSVAVAGSLLLIAHLSVGRGISRAFSVPGVVFIGAISYEIYLWHYPIIIGLDRLLPGPDPAVWRVLITVSATFLGAYLSHRFVSAPLSRWLKPKLA